MNTRTIWKFTLTLQTEQVLNTSARIDEFISVQMQNGEITLWAEVETNDFGKPRTIRIVGTGHPLPDKPHHYIGTAQDGDGFVWHIYDITPN